MDMLFTTAWDYFIINPVMHMPDPWKRINTINRLNAVSMQQSPENDGLALLWLQILDSSFHTDHFRMDSHTHTSCEVHMLLDGRITYQCGGEAITIGPGEGVFIAPNVSHQYLRDDARSVRCSFALSADVDSPFYPELCRHRFQRFRFGREVSDCLTVILDALERGDSFSMRIVRGRAFEIVCSALQGIGCVFPESSGAATDDPRFELGREYIRAHLFSKLTSEAVAAECNLSVRQLTRIFKKYTGQSLFAYIRAEKLRAAEGLLIDRAHSIKEVGYMLGFDNEQYFNSSFKQYFGMPPGLFVRLHTSDKDKPRNP